MYVRGQKYQFWEWDAHLSTHTIPEICWDPEVVGEEPQLHMGSW